MSTGSWWVRFTAELVDDDKNAVDVAAPFVQRFMRDLTACLIADQWAADVATILTPTAEFLLAGVFSAETRGEAINLASMAYETAICRAGGLIEDDEAEDDDDDEASRWLALRLKKELDDDADFKVRTLQPVG